MPTITGATIVGKAKIIVQDTTGIRWGDPEWLGWTNSAQREICIARPHACTKIATVALVAGTKQTLPADGITFLEFMRNMGVGGATPGASARKVPRQLLDSQVPGWHSMAGTASAQHYVFDPLAPKNFYVYPPSLGTSSVELLYAAAPADLASLASVISVDDVYETIILDYITYRAWLKDSEFIGNAERAQLARKAFDLALGLKSQADASTIATANVKG